MSKETCEQIVNRKLGGAALIIFGICIVIFSTSILFLSPTAEESTGIMIYNTMISYIAVALPGIFIGIKGVEMIVK